MGQPVEPNMDAIMALGDDVMRQIPPRLQAEANQKPATAFERSRPKNKFI